MNQRINLNKSVFNKEDFLKTVDTSFSQLVPPPTEEEEIFTVDQFFEEYEKLFFEIPKEGEVNSHEYLAQRSGEYASFEQVNEEIQALLDEIAELRQSNLDLQQEVFDLQINQSLPNDSSSARRNALRG